MGPDTFTQNIGIWLAAILTLCVYSFLIKDNFMFKLTEAIFIGVSVGVLIVMTYQTALYPKVILPLVRYKHNVSVSKDSIKSNVFSTVASITDAEATDPNATFPTNNFLKVLDDTLHRKTLDLSNSAKLSASLVSSITSSGLNLSNAPTMLSVTDKYLNKYVKIRKSQHYWVLYIFVSLLLGILYLSRFFPKHAWLSRFPMAYLLGIGVGLNVPLGFQSQILGQIKASIIPIIYKSPEGVIIWSLTFGNIALLVGFLSVLYYFFFSLKKNDIVSKGLTKIGIGYLMLGFGASFAFTIMARISLLTGRVAFLKEDWWEQMVIPLFQKIF